MQTLREKENYKYLEILEVDTIEQIEMKEKIRKDYLRRTWKLLETKLCNRNLIKGINTDGLLLIHDKNRLFLWRRDGRRGLASSEECVDATIQGLDEYTEKSKKRLITVAIQHQYPRNDKQNNNKWIIQAINVEYCTQ